VTHAVPRKVAHPAPHIPTFIEVINNEEKGSDVNLATHLVLDGCRDAYDVAVIISNDSDLEEPLRVTKRELGKVVGLISPLRGNQPSSPQLVRHADFVKRIRDKQLQASQFPLTLTDAGGTFHKPPAW
jgi:uncharacterized LabA/DUF88 family protein